jgi:predicted amidohydrolase YtcJ
MKFLPRLCLIAFSLLAAIPSLRAAEGPPADLVVLNGKVLTVDARFSTAEAVAVRDGVFVLVGSNADAKKLIGAKTRVLDAGGKSVVPGLIETHVHATGVARAETVQPFVQLGSIAEMQEWVRRQAATTPAGEWIRLPRADLTRIRERRLPTRAELDAATTQHPVLFNWQYAQHQVQVLNTLGLKTAQITRDTPDPKGGKIVKDAQGEPTGRIEEPRGLTAKFMMRRSPSEAEYLQMLEDVLHHYNAIGITSINERNSNVEGYRTYEKLKKDGRLTVRATVTLGLRSDGTLAGTEKVIQALPVRFGDGDDWVRVGPLKVAVDGGILYGTAYMRDPYGEAAVPLYGLTDPNFRGALQRSPEEVKNMIRAGHRLGWQMCSHVTGDAGVDVVLDAVEAANRDAPIKERRYTLIHAYFPNASAVRRAAELGVCVDTQPAWFYKDGDALAVALGGERLRHFIGVGEWLRGGVKVALNSDHMFGVDPNRSLNPYNPFLAMYTAITRKTESGLVLGPEQRISREDALRLTTIDAAYQSFDEKRKGSIEVGKLGDLAVLTEDFLTCPEERLKDIQVQATVVGGKVVYAAKAEGGKP